MPYDKPFHSILNTFGISSLRWLVRWLVSFTVTPPESGLIFSKMQLGL